MNSRIPAIRPVPPGMSRPFWSVMIPSYNRPGYLRKTLESVLQQDPGPHEMQIEVIDNCSSIPGIAEAVSEIRSHRVDFFRQPRNVGMVANWNTCVQRARGRWVHILHDDDMVLPGFYAAYEEIIQAVPSAVMVAGPAIIIDENDNRIRLTRTLVSDALTVKNFVAENATENTIRTPAVVVRREAYERVGGFLTLFDHAADWDMWFRVAMEGVVGWQRCPLALYREHDASDTSRIVLTAKHVQESYLLTALNMIRQGLGDNGRAWRDKLAHSALGWAYTFECKGLHESQFQHARWAFALQPSLRNLKLLVRSWLQKSWV